MSEGQYFYSMWLLPNTSFTASLINGLVALTWLIAKLVMREPKGIDVNIGFVSPAAFLILIAALLFAFRPISS